jgi:GDPmannose 4,6-dehydratase
MLQQDEPDDYVVATGESYSVRGFIEAAFGYAGLDWKKYIAFDPRYLRPAERWTTCWATRRRRGSGWAGGRASASRSWCG